MQAASQCSIGFTIVSTLIGGLLGSLGFFINMFIISGLVYFFKLRKMHGTKEAANRILASLRGPQ